MNDIQIEEELMQLVRIEIKFERMLIGCISKDEKQIIKVTRKQLQETRISLLKLLELEKLALQKK